MKKMEFLVPILDSSYFREIGSTLVNTVGRFLLSTISLDWYMAGYTAHEEVNARCEIRRERVIEESNPLVYLGPLC